MGIKYYLIENKLTATPDDCAARTQSVATISFEEILKRMTGRGMTLTDTEVTSVINELTHVLNDALQEGHAVSTPFMRISPSIMGVFNSKDDLFDHTRHSIKLNASIGPGISVDHKKIKTQKIPAPSKSPVIMQVKDYLSQEVDTILSRNGTAEIIGENLKIAEEDPEQGIFISNGNHEVRVSTYMHNKPSHIIFMVPNDAPGGQVQIIIRNMSFNSKQLRQFIFDKTVTLP